MSVKKNHRPIIWTDDGLIMSTDRPPLTIDMLRNQMIEPLNGGALETTKSTTMRQRLVKYSATISKTSNNTNITIHRPQQNPLESPKTSDTL